MRRRKWMAFCAAMMCVVPLGAEEVPVMPAMPGPTGQHGWLKKFVGEWEVETEIYLVPGAEPMKATGSESARMLGGFWVVGEGTGDLPGMSMNWLITFGYDPEKEVFVGRWIDSMTSQRWDYVGSLDEGGRVLTLTTRGFCPTEGRVCDFESTVAFESDDVRVMTEKKKTDDGWVTAVVSKFTRKS